MSTGPGHIQRKLLLYFQRPGYAAPLCELAQRIFNEWPRDVTESQRAAVSRAVKGLIRKGHPFATMRSYRFGKPETVVYKIKSERSRALALSYCERFPKEPGEDEIEPSPLRSW